MKKYSRLIKSTLGVEDKAFQGAGRKLGGDTPQNPSPHLPQVCISLRTSTYIYTLLTTRVHLFQGNRRDPAAGPSSHQPHSRLLTKKTKEPGSKNVHQDFQKTVVESIKDSACEDAMSEMLAGQRKGEVDVESFRIILKVLSNIIESEPGDSKVRRLRMTNPKIQKYIVEAPGAMELLLGCGFEVLSDEGALVLPEDADISSIVRRVVKAIQRLLGVSSTTTKNAKKEVRAASHEEEVMSPDMRGTILELPTPIDTDVPDWFFEQSSAEIRQLYLEYKEKVEKSRVLMTQAMREKVEKRLESPAKPTIRIRVRAPEGTKIVGDFKKKEPIQALFAWISDCLVDPMLEFDVILPDRRRVGDMRFEHKTLEEAGLTDSVTLNLSWQGESISAMKHTTAFRENI